MTGGIQMIRQLITNGYYLPVLRVLANITPRFFNHREVLLEEEGLVFEYNPFHLTLNFLKQLMDPRVCRIVYRAYTPLL